MATTIMIKLLKAVSLYVLVFALVCLPSCRKNQEPTKLLGGTLIVGQTLKPSTLNPILEFSGVSAQITCLIYDGLIKTGSKGEVLPHLASSWEIKQDGWEWLFFLRKGVKFHDGHPLTAKDVEFTFTLAGDKKLKNAYSNVFQQVEKIQVINPLTISIYLKQPSFSFISGLDLGILPKHLLEGVDIRTSSFNFKPVGTGPFCLAKWSPKSVELTANQGYFLGRPYLDRVVVKSMETQSLLWAKLMSEEIDVFDLHEPSSLEIAKKIPHLKIYSTLKPYYYLMAFNQASPLFLDKRVRQALNYAVDKPKIIEKVLGKQGLVCAGTILPESWAFHPRLKPFPYHPQKALELLAEAGWQDTNGDHILDKDNRPLEFTLLLFEGFQDMETCALMIMEQLSEIGVKIRIKTLPHQQMIQEHILKRDFEAAIVFANTGTDPDYNYQLWHSSQIEQGFNFFSYHQPQVDSLLDQGRSIADQEQRKRIYYQYQEEMRDNPPGIFLYWKHNFFAVHQRFQGVRVSPFSWFRNIPAWYVPEDEQRRK